MITIEVNGKKIEATPNENLLKVLERNEIQVPTLCYIKDMFPSGACRMCVVEVEGQQNLVPSCAYPVFDGMKVKTHSPRVLRSRRTILELLLANHPDDCLYCTRNGECELQSLSQDLQVRHKRFSKTDPEPQIDISSEAIVRDQSKCILCGRCVRVCEEVMSVSCIDFINRGSHSRIGTAFDSGLNGSTCVSCGQCVISCPTGALKEQENTDQVLAALADPEKVVVVQHAPSVSVTLGEYFGLEPGADTDGQLVAALRRMGFKYVFDTGFSADLTIMEEASELVHRIQNKGKLPMMTSCSPGWINFVETFYPSWIENLSTCKSPQQMMGAMIKSYFAEKAGIDPRKIYSVSIMPCTAKKRESARPEMQGETGAQDVDAVLTTREFARLIKQKGIDFGKLKPESADSILGTRSSAGKIFGAAGGVMEAALRTAYHFITGEELTQLEFREVRGLDGIKEAVIPVGGLEVKVAAVNGLGNARKLLDEMTAGLREYHFVEVMTCPGGCIAGGGQPHFTDINRVKARMRALYDIDRKDRIRCSHLNPQIQQIYSEFLGKPLGHRSHELLHTHYEPQSAGGAKGA